MQRWVSTNEVSVYSIVGGILVSKGARWRSQLEQTAVGFAIAVTIL